MIQTENQIRMKCKRCNHEWIYTGDKNPNSIYPKFVTCPNCLTSVKLNITPNIK